MSATLKRLIFYVLTVLILVLGLEMFASALALHYYRAKGELSQLDGFSRFSSVLIVERALNKLPRNKVAARQGATTSPSPFLSEDPALGYRPNVGRYEFTYSRPSQRGAGKIEYLKHGVTILADHTRYVGEASRAPRRRVLVFGDSFVWGAGVNDEHTFTYLLQQHFKDSKFELHAVGGYSMSSAYVQLTNLNDMLTMDDVVILGYGDYFKVRDVAAPSRLREWTPYLHLVPRSVRHLRAGLTADGKLHFDFIPLSCAQVPEYCAQADPGEAEMNRVTATLINEIARQTKARVLLFHFAGPRTDGIFTLLSKRVEVIHATQEDFDYVIRDDILGFDRHPGPFWHYQMFKKLSAALTSPQQAAAESRPSDR